MSKKRLECAMNSTYTEDGIRILGHVFLAKLATYDMDVDRTYYFSICENCDKAEASWENGKAEEYMERYEYRQIIGGEPTDKIEGVQFKDDE